MTETTQSPFDPFKPSDPPGTAPAANKPKHKRASGNGRKRAAATPQAMTPAVEKAKPPRKKRERKLKVPSALKIEFGTAMALAAEMKPADTELFGQIVVALQKVGKGSRARIAIALGKMFG